MGEVLKFVTPHGGLRKKTLNKLLRFFAKIVHFKDLFRLDFGLKDLFRAAKNVHKLSIKRTGGHKLNYQTFFLMILCVRPRKAVKIF